MSLPLTRHFTHYAAMGSLDPLRKCKLADFLALLVARYVSPRARSGRADDEALPGRFHDFLGERVQPIEGQETPDLGKEALQ